MGRGRPPKPGTAEEKAEARRERVRKNVRALRERRKLAALATASDQVFTNDISEFAQDGDDLEPITTTELVSEREDVDPQSHNGLVVLKKMQLSPSTTNAPYFMNKRTFPIMGNPVGIDNRGLYQHGMIATFRRMFLPDSIELPQGLNSPDSKPWNSSQFLWTPCAFWVTSAFAKAADYDTSVLKTGLLAIGMLIQGLENSDMALRTQSHEMYRRCLRGIRNTLDPMIQGTLKKPKDRVSLYLACHAAAMFELVMNSDLSATMRHLRGVSQLICHLGDDSDDEGQAMAWLLLQDYRFAEMGLCMKFRYSSYSSIAGRKFEKANIDQPVSLGCSNSQPLPRQARGHGSQNMLVALTDIADEISATMMKLDAIKPNLSRPETPERLGRMLETLDQIWHEFPHLHDRLIQLYGNAFVYDDSDEAGPGKRSYKFKTFDIGAGWCYNLMTQLYCLEESIQTTTLLLRLNNGPSPRSVSTPETAKSSTTDSTNTESLEEFASSDRLHELRRLHRAICIQLTQCLLYFLQTDKGITGQALAIYPLDAALNMLTVEMNRLKVDLKQAQLESKPKEALEIIRRDITSIGNAKTFVQKMQDRAKAFGLPSFHEASASDFSPTSPKT